MKSHENNLFARDVTTDSLGTISVSFYYYPEERETISEPYVPAEMNVYSIEKYDCDITGQIDEFEFMEVRNTVWDLLREEQDVDY